ncbi:MAG: addiction module protein [Kiritimatiellae bacterium]|nr:addiction module protein [Kiritimatiellia bacterium]
MPLATMMDEVQDYPVEQRAALADAVLQTLNPVDPAIQAAWLETASRRRGEILSGAVRSLPADEVLAEARAVAEGLKG